MKTTNTKIIIDDVDFKCSNDFEPLMGNLIERKINWEKYGYKWIPIEEKESFVKQVWSKTRWSHEKCASLLSDADGYELIPVHGLDWWIDFVKRTSKQL